MNEPTPPADTSVYWQRAWLTVWSPFVAWLASFVLLWASGLFPWWGTGIAGLAVGLGGLAGGFASTGLAASVLEGDGPTVSGGEKARLEVLSVTGILVSVLGYGSLMLFGGFVALVSPFRDLQLG